MQEKDVISIEYFEDAERFADLLNGYVFQGKQVIRPEDVGEMNRVITKTQKHGQGMKSKVLIRDVVRKVDIGIQVVLIALENQTDIHYAMPIRVMDADASVYYKQWKEKRLEHEKKKDLKGAEFLSGFAKDDRLIPTLTLVIYFGSKPWDGPKKLKDMMDLSSMPEYLQNMIADYPMQLLEVRNYPDPEHFKTDLQFVFGFLKYAANKKQLMKYVEEHEEVFSHLSEQTYDMISCMSKSEELKTVKQNYQEEKGGSINMCQAITEMIADGKREGEKTGEKRGEKRFANLTQMLINEGKVELLLKATMDAECRDRLYLKYQL